MRRTGNPFVDMGLCTIAAIGGKDSISELTTEDFRKVLSIKDIAAINDRLKSFTMVLGTNNFLKQYAYKDHNKEMYTDFLYSLLKSMESSIGKGRVCEICGEEYDYNLDVECGNITHKYGYEKKEKYVGRDFFPLCGSIGNDAQALPSASRTIEICPKCLFAVNFIPLGTMLIKGRLVCIESTSEIIMLELINEIVRENTSRISAGISDIYGKKEGGSEIYQRLLRMFTNLQQIKKQESLPESCAIYLWLFSNSGTGPDCSIIEIPNRSLRFIWEVSRKSQDFKNEFISLLRNDSRGRIFDCINANEDYEGLYPKGKYKGVSVELYEHYQTIIVGRPIEGLYFARLVAKKLLEGKDKKEIANLQKSDVFKDAANRILAKKAMAGLAEDGYKAYNGYLDLFSIGLKYLTVNEASGFNVIMYYLNKCLDDIRGDDVLENAYKSEKSDKRIIAFSELYFDYYVKNKGIARFKKEVLDNYKNFNEGRLREGFARIAEVYERKDMDLGYDNWINFITDDNGNRRVYELLFQLRLAFANLYYQYNKMEEKK